MEEEGGDHEDLRATRLKSLMWQQIQGPFGKICSEKKLNFQILMEVVASGRGSEEGRRLANIFQQVAADYKVNLQQRFSQYSLAKNYGFLDWSKMISYILVWAN